VDLIDSIKNICPSDTVNVGSYTTNNEWCIDDEYEYEGYVVLSGAEESLTNHCMSFSG